MINTWTLKMKHKDGANPSFSGVKLNGIDIPVTSVKLSQSSPHEIMTLQLEIILHKDFLKIINEEKSEVDHE
jgi:hypothetical protein